MYGLAVCLGAAALALFTACHRDDPTTPRARRLTYLATAVASAASACALTSMYFAAH